MLRQPRPDRAPATVTKKAPKKSFRIVRLEERIAPRCHTNPHGKQVGNCPPPGPGK